MPRVGWCLARSDLQPAATRCVLWDAVCVVVDWIVCVCVCMCVFVCHPQTGTARTPALQKLCLCVAIDSMAPVSSGTAALSSMSRSIYKGYPCAIEHNVKTHFETTLFFPELLSVFQTGTFVYCNNLTDCI